MKHLMLEELYHHLCVLIEPLERIQGLALAGLSISRLWYPFQKWAVQNKAPKMGEWGKTCEELLWKQILEEQVYGSEFELYDKCSEKIQRKIGALEDRDISVEGSAAWPFLEVLDSALCCFYDPKLLPGLQGWRKPSFYEDVAAVVGQGAEFIYDCIFSNADVVTEQELISLVNENPVWQRELGRIEEDIACVKSFPGNRQAILERRDTYQRLDIFQGLPFSHP